MRVLETAGAPVYYFPPDDVRQERLVESAHRSMCEWKGAGRDITRTSVRTAVGSIEVAWSYAEPNPGYEAIRGYLAFYAGRVDEAWVGDERRRRSPVASTAAG